MDQQPLSVSPTRFLGFSGYHWLVIAAGWAGWGFDVFDALLFNFVAPNCIPALLHLPPGSRAAHEATVFWTGAITSILLVGWAVGGVVFGWVADRIGRKRALFATITIYAAGTGLCALVGNLGELILCRAIASLGIGGEWGIGAALVAESVPEERRVEAGVIMQTSSPLGIVLASAVNYQIAGVWFAISRRAPGATCFSPACCRCSPRSAFGCSCARARTGRRAARAPPPLRRASCSLPACAAPP